MKSTQAMTDEIRESWPDFRIVVEAVDVHRVRVIAKMTVHGAAFDVPTEVLAVNVDAAKDVLVDTCHRIATGRTHARP